MAKGRKPDYDVYSVIGDGSNAQWTKIGGGWTNDDQKGVTCQLSAHPIGTRLVLREYKPKEKDGDDSIPY